MSDSQNNYKIRLLKEQDWQLWKDIRLEALKNHPESFSGSYEEESQWSQQKFEQALKQSDIFGAFADQKLVGIACFFIHPREKMKHRGVLHGMYIKPAFRGTGIAEKLVKKIINHASEYVLQLHCTVVTENDNATHFYKNRGFQIYGTEPRSTRVGDRFYDEHLMVLKLK